MRRMRSAAVCGLKWTSRTTSRYVRQFSSNASAPERVRKTRRITVRDVRRMYENERPIVTLTAYDYPSGTHADAAGVDIVLVGDSVGMVMLGHNTTQRMTVDQMVYHSQAVNRGVKHALIVGDMPFGSYEVNREDGLRNALRLVKEGGVGAVKLEGGVKRKEVIEGIVDAGIAVMGHIGLSPQSVSALGGFRAMGRTAEEAESILDDALAVQDAGAFAMVIECVPARLAKVITDNLSIPTIGIGAGHHVSGQVLVYHDVIGMDQHPHHAKVAPKFCKRYAETGKVIGAALESYRDEVIQHKFPLEQYAPYKIPDDEFEKFQEQVSLHRREKKFDKKREITRDTPDSDQISPYGRQH